MHMRGDVSTPQEREVILRQAKDESGESTTDKTSEKTSADTMKKMETSGRVQRYAEPACVIVKHANPCGVAVAATPLEAYRKAFATDPTSGARFFAKFHSKNGCYHGQRAPSACRH